MKYIDADKLIAEIERRLKSLHEWKTGWERRLPLSRNKTYYKNFGKESAYDAILNTITSLQQEQPEVDLEEEVKRWKNKYGVVGMDDLWLDFARHFYELGQRTKYQQDREEFAKLKAKEWQEGYDEGYAKGLNARKEE